MRPPTPHNMHGEEEDVEKENEENEEVESEEIEVTMLIDGGGVHLPMLPGTTDAMMPSCSAVNVGGIQVPWPRCPRDQPSLPLPRWRPPPPGV